jgi:hypothetical protein
MVHFFQELNAVYNTPHDVVGGGAGQEEEGARHPVQSL